MNGINLAHYVRNRWPPIVIIVTSGLAKVTMDQLPAGSDFLAKPLSNRPPSAVLTRHGKPRLLGNIKPSTAS